MGGGSHGGSEAGVSVRVGVGGGGSTAITHSAGAVGCTGSGLVGRGRLGELVGGGRGVDVGGDGGGAVRTETATY